MPVIKKSDVTSAMMNKRPVLAHDIGAGAKILALSHAHNGFIMTCLERDGVRTNFAMSTVITLRGHKYIQKCDGVNENGVVFRRYVNVDNLCRTVKHKRVRNATEVLSESGI